MLQVCFDKKKYYYVTKYVCKQSGAYLVHQQTCLLVCFECNHHEFYHRRVLRGSVVKCLTRNPGVLGSSHTGSSVFFHGSVLGQDTSDPSLVLVKPRKDMNNVSCRRDMTEILLKVA